MAYSTQDAANTILKLKNQWLEADSADDTAKKNQIAANAQTYYNQMRSNGDSKIADTLSNSNLEQSKKYINDYFAKQGRSAIRPYFYTLGQKYGMSQSDIDNALSFDETTGEVSFGGKNIGKPAAISSNGVSYWDNDTLDNSFADYVSRTGTSRSASNLVRQENDNLAGKYNNLYDTYMQDYKDLKETNPFETAEGKAIMGKYDLSALQGRDNQLASGAASNGGNIDSYSAANAMRQQASLISVGQQAVMDAYNSKVENANTKLENARQLLSDMGVNISRVAADHETALNNQVTRDVATSEVTGKVPESMSYANNPYFNADGTLKRVDNVDYAAIIKNAQAKLANTTDPSEQEDLKATIKYARQARAYKILNHDAYNKYIDTMVTPDPEETESARQFNESMKNSLILADKETDAAKAQLESNEKIAGIEAQNNLDQITTAAAVGAGKPELTASQATTAIKNGETSQAVIDAYNYHYGTSYTVDNPPKLDGYSNFWGGGMDGDAGTNGDAWTTFLNYFPTTESEENKKIVAFLNEQLKPYYDNNREINEEVIEKLIVGTNIKNSNSTKYDIDVNEAKAICNALGLDTSWVDKYKDRWGLKSGKGMKFAE